MTLTIDKLNKPTALVYAGEFPQPLADALKDYEDFQTNDFNSLDVAYYPSTLEMLTRDAETEEQRNLVEILYNQTKDASIIIIKS